jgi:hypothetical protein
VHSYCKFLYAEYENNLYLIIRLHFYPFYFGLGQAGLARTQPGPKKLEPVKARPEKTRPETARPETGSDSSKKARTKPGWPGPRANTIFYIRNK